MADGPIPVGEAIGAVLVSGALAYDITYHLYYGDASATKTDAPAVPLTATETREDEDKKIRVRHYTSSDNLKKIKAKGFINPGAHGPPYGVDVEVFPFGSISTAKDDFRALGNAYIEFDVSLSELSPIPNVYVNDFRGRNTARVITGLTPASAMANPVQLSNRNPRFSKYWKFW